MNDDIGNIEKMLNSLGIRTRTFLERDGEEVIAYIKQ